jgi:mannan endo-1,4-beta-mannosidase
MRAVYFAALLILVLMGPGCDEDPTRARDGGGTSDSLTSADVATTDGVADFAADGAPPPDGPPDGPTPDSAPPAKPTMYVQGSTLHDRCGEKVVLRGANAGIAFPSDPQAKKLAELAKTGANAVRLTFRWIYNQSSPQDVDTALTEAFKHEMIPIPAVWDATGDWSKLGFCVDFWLKPDMVKVLKKHEAYTLLNIANEAGKSDVTDAQFKQEYAKAIKKLRAAGLRMPLVIDAANWGRDESYIINNGSYLVAQDPEQNIVFDWHPWDTNQPQSRYKKAIDDSLAKKICMVVGEFSQIGVNYSQPVDYAYIMKYAQQKQIGWLWWWWYGNDKHSLTGDGTYGNWANAGQTVCVTSPDSIKNTSARTHYFQTGSCK